METSKTIIRRFGELRKIDTESRKAEFIISNATRDRHRTVLNPQGWILDNYNKNPVVGYQHDIYGSFFGDTNPDNVIGKGSVRLEGDNLIGVVEFEPADINPLAEKLMKKVEFGSIRATSVGFLPVANENGKEGYWGPEERGEQQGGPNETYYYYGQELVEWSIVNIPSNPDAIKNALPQDKEKFLMQILRDILGEKYADEDIEKLTIKGISNILNGNDAATIEEAETLRKVEEEKRKKRAARISELNNYIKMEEDYYEQIKRKI